MGHSAPARRRDERHLRKEEWLVLNASSRHESVLPEGAQEISELIGCTLEDLTSLRYGIKSTMWMSRSAQLDTSAQINKPASYALSNSGLMIAVRGTAVVHHEQADLREERSKLRDLARQRAAEKRSLQ
jgi:hypothetical protein